VIALVAFAALGALAYARLGPGRLLPESAAAPTGAILWGLAAYAGLSAFLAPLAVKPLYLALTVVTYPIGFVLSYLMMVIIFYGVITPVGLVFKLIGRDAMNRRFDPSTSSYWVERRPPESIKRYFRQF
jgi:hypothetical protein